MDSNFGRKLLKLAALLIVVAFSVAAFAQTETGMITGTVTDPQNAVVTGAKVRAKNVATGAERSTTSGDSGLYTLSSMGVGTYDVSVETSSFGKSTKRVQVTVGSRNTLDFALKVGAAVTTVEVVGEGGVAVDTRTQALDQVVSSQQITEVPTLTRNAYSLVGLSGNVSGNDPTGRGVGVSINGQRASSTGILLDGGENVDLFVAATGQLTPLDSVGEFRVITNNFSAEYGRASGGIVNVSTKGGSNAFHGTAYEFYRGAGLSSNTYENNANGITKPNFVRNQFGYSFGGPIIKNKLFFFSSTEWIRVRSGATITSQVIDPAFLAASNANTQAFYTAFGALKPSVDVLSTSNSNTVAQSFSASATGAGGCMGYTYPRPAPQNTVAGTDTGTFCTFALNNIGAPVPVFNDISFGVPANAGGGDPRDELQTVARVDFTVSDKTSLFGRYTLQKQNFFAGTVSFSPYTGFDTGATTYNQNMLFSVTHIWTPHVVTTFKGVFNRLNQLQPLAGDASPTLYMKGGATQNFQGDPIALPGWLPYTPGNGIPFGGPQNLYQVYGDLRWTKGKHQISFGGQYIHTRDNRTFGAYQTASEILGTNVRTALDNFLDGQLRQFQAAVDPQGAFPCATQDQNAFTPPSNTRRGTAVPIVVPGCQITLPVTQPVFGRNNRYNDTAAYFEDSWRIRPRFTLNLGLRWEYYGVQHNVNPSLDSNFYYGDGANVYERIRNGQVLQSTSAANPNGALWAPDFNNFAPRVGFAWDLFGNGKTSLRGGFGMGYERNFGNVTFNVIQNPPAYAVISLLTGDPSCQPCVVTTNNAGPLGTGVGTVNLPKTSTRSPLTNIRTAYSYFYSLSVQREVAKNTVVEVGYTGSEGVKLYSIENPSRRAAGPLFLGDNPADQLSGGIPVRRLNDQYTNINQRGQTGASHYDALNVRLQTNNFMNTGWTFVTNYTWSHSTDNLSSTFSEAGNNFNLGYLNPYRPQDERGSADFDIRHRWVFGGTWDVPWFKKDQNWLKKNLLGGWTFAPVITVQTGSPFTVWDCSEAFFEVCQRWIPAGTFSTAKQNPTVDQCIADPSQSCNTFQYIDLATIGANTWVNPVAGTGEWGICDVGTGLNTGCPFPSNMTGRNIFRSPGVWNVDMGIYKSIPLTERFKLQLRGEFYNMFNHPNLYVRGSTADFAEGQVTAKRGGFGTANDERRNIQLAIKLIF